MSKFESYHDWSLLADYFDITVTDEEIDEVSQQLDNKNLLIKDEDPDDYKSDAIHEIGITPYYFKIDVERDIKLHKLKNKLLQMSIDFSRDADVDQDEIDIVRHFVQNHADYSLACSALFWQSVADIKDDYTFLKFVAKNLEELWY